MKLRKFFGLTSRSVLEQVRSELGADAMIVANHATSDGVEVTALAGDAIDTLLGQVKSPPCAPRCPPEGEAGALGRPGGAPPSRSQPGVKSVEPAQPAKPSADPDRVTAPPASHREPMAWRPPLAIVGGDDDDHDAAVEVFEPVVAAAPAAPPDTLGPQLAAELAAMREMIDQRFALMSWNDGLRRRPLAARLTRDLLAAGYSAALARSITGRLPDDMTSAQARSWVVKVLARNLRCIDNTEEIVTRGGVYALVGPTGVGKTTTTAKLAARCAVRYGASRLALISTDSFRIGAQDQLRIYARILGVAVHTVSDRHGLREALEAVRGRHLVLIDTVGMGQRDDRVAEQAMLLAQPQIRRLLLLNAAAQGDTLDEVADVYGRMPETIDEHATSPLAGCIVTKQDEATRHGTALDVAIRRKLPLHYVTSGQRVPEDIFVPTAELMIERSLRGGTKPSPFALNDDELLLAVGGATEAAYA